MNCHICGEPSVGQCQACWRFYCKRHGEIVCEKCKGQEGPFLRIIPGERETWQSSVVPTEEAERMAKVMQEQLEKIPVLKFKGDVLQRVIPVVQTVTRGTTELTLIDIEVYDDGFTLGYEVRRTGVDIDSGMGLMFPKVHWSALDDVGQEYMGMNRGGSSTRRGWRARDVFAPTLVSEATKLILESEEVLWMAHGVGHRSQTEPGPWRFEIPLT